MRKFILPVFILILSGCAKKEWTKDALVNDCLGDLNKRNDKEKRFDPARIPYLCNCMADKMIAKYKSEKESARDKEGGEEIGRECVKEVLGD
jgi:hypothetical protein